MRFIQETGFTVKPTKYRALQDWIAENQERLAKSYPPGTSLVGTFVTVFTSEKGAGEFRVLEQLDSYAALDRFAALGKDPESDYSKLMTEFLAFVDMSPAAGWSSVLLKDTVDATVFDATDEELPERELAPA